MHKKTIVSILCLSLSLSIFATGCGNKDGVNNQSKIQNKSSTTVQDSNNKQNSIEKEKTTTSNTNNLSTKEEDWFFEPKKDGSPSTVPPEIEKVLSAHDGYFLGDTSKKEIFLTFDEGYENGYTGKILDVLKANNVKAAFFVVKPYIDTNKDLIKRMVDEGHLVCNHSNHHPSMAKVALKGKDKFIEEFTVTEKAFKDVTGKDMPKFFRPPMGKYSELSLDYTKELGYKSIFWSFAYADWDKNKQPDPERAKKRICSHAHNGAIFLLHAVSKTNAEILDSVIKDIKNQGFTFQPLDKLK